jgi:hypothetical protein
VIARGRRSGIALGLVVALFVLGPVQPPRGWRLWTHQGLPLMLTVDGGPADAAAVLRRVAGILHVDLGLPLPARIAARVYDGPARFEQGLVRYASVPAAYAAELARFAIGATTPGAVFLVAPTRATTPSIEWPRLIAHELTHLAQIELAGGETGQAQWLAEGMAEWVAYRVLERLDVDDFESRRALARAAAVEYVGRAGGLDLDGLATPAGFLAHHRRLGTLVTYRLVLHLADELVTQHGFASLVGYFRAFRLSPDPAGNFAASFGGSLDAFARTAQARLESDRLDAVPGERQQPRVVPAGKGTSL